MTGGLASLNARGAKKGCTDHRASPHPLRREGFFGGGGFGGKTPPFSPSVWPVRCAVLLYEKPLRPSRHEPALKAELRRHVVVSGKILNIFRDVRFALTLFWRCFAFGPVVRSDFNRLSGTRTRTPYDATSEMPDMPFPFLWSTARGRFLDDTPRRHGGSLPRNLGHVHFVLRQSLGRSWQARLRLG